MEDIFTSSRLKGKNIGRFGDGTRIRCALIPFYSIDGSDSQSMGKYANHSRKNPNAKMVVSQTSDEGTSPLLLLVATRYIRRSEEILHDYGDRNGQSVKEFPWLKE